MSNNIAYGKLVLHILKGGPGSGHRGHVGRPGKRGGSLPGSGGAVGAPFSPMEHSLEESKKAFAFCGSNLRSNVYAKDWEQWMYTGYEKRGEIKHEIVSAIAERSGLEYDAVNKMIAQWSQTSNDTDMRSLSLQQAASEEFGVQLNKWQQERIVLASLASHADKWYDRVTERKFLRAMYDITQERLVAHGYSPTDTVELYRGTRSVRTGVGVFPYAGSAMESWSAGYSVAIRFGDYVVKAQVPISSIIGTCRSGFGCVLEGEFVAMGSIPGSSARVIKAYKR